VGPTGYPQYSDVLWASQDIRSIQISCGPTGYLQYSDTMWAPQDICSIQISCGAHRIFAVFRYPVGPTGYLQYSATLWPPPTLLFSALSRGVKRPGRDLTETGELYLYLIALCLGTVTAATYPVLLYGFATRSIILTARTPIVSALSLCTL